MICENFGSIISLFFKVRQNNNIDFVEITKVPMPYILPVFSTLFFFFGQKFFGIGNLEVLFAIHQKYFKSYHKMGLHVNINAYFYRRFKQYTQKQKYEKHIFVKIKNSLLNKIKTT